ncbi:putative apses transcription factor xbp1 [Golovinomyces cichoracearum]|uniref:Putative apses transcription factor xbp1 n=1 Tax=Golovinomyces cichoracearum TaxID=62708 RepID=A0A420HQI8_9PEZI|nr:putative apses transcription factor xbp1 [Golovinomyces cichoracearum]
MFSVASLLNPVKMEQDFISPSPSSPDSPTQQSLSTLKPVTRKQGLMKIETVSSKTKLKGEVCFSPYEDLDETTAQEVKKFEVYPLGKIKEYSRHIPYNSGKKSFLKKTGRESFEVFQYMFKIPGFAKEYTVMWDYNIGLVRITPFFKCCNYTKTTPAKMLSRNPGLKEITHSITGGALIAQGYWMPFFCAREICATFCHHFAPALIPIFGPSFPSICVHPTNPEYGRMVISPETIAKATVQAEASRLQYGPISVAKVTTPPSSPCKSLKYRKRNTSKKLSINERNLPAQQTGTCETGQDIKLYSDHPFSAINPAANQWFAQGTLYQLENLGNSSSRHSPPLKRSHSFLTNTSHLRIRPYMNNWDQEKLSENQSIKRKAFTKTFSEGIHDVKTGIKACLCSRESPNTDCKFQKYEVKSESSNRSEEAKAAYSLINLRLKCWKVRYGDTENGREPHVKRYRATST